MDDLDHHAAVLRAFRASQLNVEARPPGRLDDGHAPGTVQAELRDYTDLFSKLKVTYLEQETKERFLRTVLDETDVGPLPLWAVGPDSLAAEEDKNVDLKAALKAKKRDLAGHADAIAELVARVAERQGALRAEADRAAGMLDELDGLRAEVAELEAAAAASAGVDGDLRLSLADTAARRRELLDERDRLSADVHAVRHKTLPERRAALAELKTEATAAEATRAQTVAAAQAAQRSHEAERREHRLELKENISGWYTHAAAVLERALLVDSVAASDADESLDVVCRTVRGTRVRATLFFAKGVFYDARVAEPAGLDLKAVLNVAATQNDLAYFVEELKLRADRPVH
ncbi:uncharacterized protein V1510DRAFT_402270 [Dipodascopsis tothii]|uniref:uncharacterized protein n=1 Tax=Dipodascopsis tothii TaxID=44089 RepID=UPI0034CED466